MDMASSRESVCENLREVVRLHDLSGFDGRCDAVYFTTEAGKTPPSDIKELDVFRRKALGLPDDPLVAGQYDLVVVGAGVAGMSAAVSAGRLGCKVALINDRPVVGGNNSSEIRVHLGGRIDVGTYKELGGLQKNSARKRRERTTCRVLRGPKETGLALWRKECVSFLELSCDWCYERR